MEERRDSEVREGRGGEVETKQNKIQHENHKRRNMKEEELQAKREGRKNRKER